GESHRQTGVPPAFGRGAEALAWPLTRVGRVGGPLAPVRPTRQALPAVARDGQTGTASRDLANWANSATQNRTPTSRKAPGRRRRWRQATRSDILHRPPFPREEDGERSGSAGPCVACLSVGRPGPRDRDVPADVTVRPRQRRRLVPARHRPA